MWEGIFGFLAGAIVATVVLWSWLGRRAQAPLLASQQALSEALGALEREQQLRELAEKKAAEYFDAIEGVVKERSNWSSLYQRVVLEYGNAQDLMMRTIDNLCRQLEKLGKKVEVSKAIKAVRQEFFETHERPLKELPEKPSADT